MSFIKTYGRCYQRFAPLEFKLNYTIYITGLLNLVVTISYDYLGTPVIESGITNGQTIQIPAVGVSNLVISAPDVLGYIKTITNEGEGIYTISYVIDPYNGHDYVEIGGVKWATMNVGATGITDCGLYFEWGNPQGYSADQIGCEEGKKCFDGYFADYKWTEDGGSTFTKYNDEDGLTTLQSADDAVAAAWGGNWRMPTTEEFQALGTATTSAWIADYEGSGVAGVVLTSNADSSKKLFFPACGRTYDGSVYGVGYNGYYWSSSFYSGYVYNAYNLYFDSGDVGWGYNSNRCDGCSVRGVVGE